MKIVCISDTHLQVKNLILPDADVLIHSGDHTGNGTKNQLNEAAKWLGQYRTQFQRIFTVAGNHDWIAQTEPGFANIAFARHGVKYLEDQGVWFDDVYFYGSPWQPWFCDWAFNFPNPEDNKELAEAAAKRVWSYIPERTNVLITHGPPAGVLDAAFGSGPYDTRTGCPYLMERIADLPHLKLHAFGHIHEQNGMKEAVIGDVAEDVANGIGRKVTFVNAAICDRRNYAPVQAYHEVTI